MKAIVIGRHQLSGEEGLEVINQKNINFPATSGKCRPILWNLLQEAIQNDAALVFQMMPGQLAIACADIIDEDTRYKIGIIVNTPGERPAGITKEFYSDSFYAAEDIKAAVEFTNPRAKATITHGGQCCTVTVDPPLRFKFNHIEWF